MTLKINKKLTKFNFTDMNDKKRIKYIVIHYYGGLSTAEQLAKYWQSKFVGASAHYCVGHAGEIYQCVEDEDIAWHCGAKSYVHASCRNSNSIGIEMAVRKRDTKKLNASDKDWYFEEATVKATVELVKILMKQYNIPANKVIRHNDVTGKICPNPYVYNNTEYTWKKFVALISNKDVSVKKKLPYMITTTIDLLPIYSGPGKKFKQVGKIAEKNGKKKAYTIVSISDGFGKLKSGAGFIEIKYTKIVTV